MGGRGGGLAETNFQLLMLSSNLLKSKVPMSGGGGEGGGGGSWWTQLSTFDTESKSAKMCLGMVLDFEYQVVWYTKYTRTIVIRGVYDYKI